VRANFSEFAIAPQLLAIEAANPFTTKRDSARCFCAQRRSFVSAGAASFLSLPRGFSPRVLKLGLAALFGATAFAWWSSRALLSVNFLPHWYCFIGNTRLLWTTVIADLLIG